MTPTPPKQHNPNEEGWCKNDGCMWNVWNAISKLSCPTRLPRRAATTGEQEELLNPTPPKSESEGMRELSDILKCNCGGNNFLNGKHYDDCAVEMKPAILALIRRREAEAVRAALEALLIVHPDGRWKVITNRLAELEGKE